MNAPDSSKIVPILPDDLQELGELSRKTFQQAFNHIYDAATLDSYFNTSFSDSQLLSELYDTNSQFWGAKYQDQWIGYAKIRSSKIPPELSGKAVIELQRMYVLKAHWGKGVAHQLMLTCIEQARQQGFSHLWLGVWGKNDRAISFYKKYGFKKVGTQQFIVTETLIDEDWVMAKELIQQ